MKKSGLAIAIALGCSNLALASGAMATGAMASENPATFFANDPYAPAQVSAAPTPKTQAKREARNKVVQTVAGLSNTPHIDAAARRHGVPVHVARATVRVESRGQCNARGRAGELGPLQIKLSTARGLGYRGSASALATCGAGLEWGMRHLAVAYRKCGHVGPHNYGLGGGCRRTAYVRKVMMAAR